MGKFSRDKGARYERKIVNILTAAGHDAARVPLSGAAGGRFTGDVHLRLAGKTYLCEVKARKNGAGFTTIEGWLEGHDILILAQNNKEPRVVMPISTFIELLEKSDDQKATTETSQPDSSRS